MKNLELSRKDFLKTHNPVRQPCVGSIAALPTISKAWRDEGNRKISVFGPTGESYAARISAGLNHDERDRLYDDLEPVYDFNSTIELEAVSSYPEDGHPYRITLYGDGCRRGVLRSFPKQKGRCALQKGSRS